MVDSSMTSRDGAKRRIATARENYFTKNPFDPHEQSILGQDNNGLPTGFLTMPNMDDMQVVAMKYGYEFLATVRTDDDVDQWIDSIVKTCQSSELAGIMFAHAFRGIAPIIGDIIDRDPHLANTMMNISATGWEKEF